MLNDIGIKFDIIWSRLTKDYTSFFLQLVLKYSVVSLLVCIVTSLQVADLPKMFNAQVGSYSSQLAKINEKVYSLHVTAIKFIG